MESLATAPLFRFVQAVSCELPDSGVRSRRQYLRADIDACYRQFSRRICNGFKQQESRIIAKPPCRAN